MRGLRSYARARWTQLRNSYWFVPSLMVGFAVLLAWGMVWVDETYAADIVQSWSWLHTRDAQGARTLLSTVAGSMITVAGVVFSITIVALTLASSQFGPRVLRTFNRDRGNHFALGAFVATFTYSLTILRSVYGGDNRSQFVPHLSVLVASGMALLSIGVLIYFIHHALVSVQSESVLARMSDDLEEAIELMFPKRLGKGEERADLEDERQRCVEIMQGDAAGLNAQRSGYLQRIDSEGLLHAAEKHGLVVQVLYRPGDFILPGTPLLRAKPAEQLTEEAAQELRAAFQAGKERSHEQDVRFGFQQLSLVASRSLSASMNDPVTAMSAVDRIVESLVRVAERATPAAFRYDDDGQLRVIAFPFAFDEIADFALSPVRQYGRDDPQTAVHALQLLRKSLDSLANPADREIIIREAQKLAAESEQEMQSSVDRERIAAEWQRLRAA